MKKEIILIIMGAFFVGSIQAQELSEIAKDELEIKAEGQVVTPSLGIATVTAKNAVWEDEKVANTYLSISASKTKLKGQASGRVLTSELSSLPAHYQLNLKYSKKINWSFIKRAWGGVSYSGFPVETVGSSAIFNERVNFHSYSVDAGLEASLYSYLDWGVNAQIGLGQSFLTYVSETGSFDGNISEAYGLMQINVRSQEFLKKDLRALLAYNRFSDFGQSSLDLTDEEVRLGLEIGW